jgi:hypothetical protein
VATPSPQTVSDGATQSFVEASNARQSVPEEPAQSSSPTQRRVQTPPDAERRQKAPDGQPASSRQGAPSTVVAGEGWQRPSVGVQASPAPQGRWSQEATQAPSTQASKGEAHGQVPTAAVSATHTFEAVQT